jgi:secretion/DNA translocation related TadE-like protein
MHPRASERGSATVTAIAMTAGGLVVCGAVILVGQLLVSVRTIQSVADLAALAASDVSMGVVSGQPCDVARVVAKRHGNYRVHCVIEGAEVEVTVSAEHAGITLSRVAHAGPPSIHPWSPIESAP